MFPPDTMTTVVPAPAGATFLEQRATPTARTPRPRCRPRGRETRWRRGCPAPTPGRSTPDVGRRGRSCAGPPRRRPARRPGSVRRGSRSPARRPRPRGHGAVGLWLHADDRDAARRERGAEAAGHAAAADRDDHARDVRRLLQDLGGQVAAVAGDDVVVVERRHEERAALGRQRGGRRLGLVVAGPSTRSSAPWAAMAARLTIGATSETTTVRRTPAREQASDMAVPWLPADAATTPTARWAGDSAATAAPRREA